MKYSTTVFAMAATALATTATRAMAQYDPVQAQILNVFPSSGAPTNYGSSTLQFQSTYTAPNPSPWAAGLNEADVFQGRLVQSTNGSQNWNLGIGKGGQIYSMQLPSLGEVMPPQSASNPWNDEVWQFDSYYKNLLNNHQNLLYDAGDAFVQTGMYVDGNSNKQPFYSPTLATNYNAATRTYSTLNWENIAHPSVNQSDVLTYSQYKDLGGGVIQATFDCYNFSPVNTLADLSPWGGLRTSALPDMVVSKTDNTYTSYTAANLPGYGAPGSSISPSATAGWFAATNGLTNSSEAVATVFGTSSSNASFGNGSVGNPIRDYTVNAYQDNINDTPGTGYSLNMFFVIGQLGNVATTAKELAPYAGYQTLNFTPANASKINLYSQTIGGQKVLGTSGETQLAAQTFAQPVTNSVPLILMQNTVTGQYFVSSDPYAECASHLTYPSNGSLPIYEPNLGQTTWLGMLGYALPLSTLNGDTQGYESLADLNLSNSNWFVAGSGLSASDLYVPTLALVPEPTAPTLVALAAMGLLLRRRRTT